MFVYRWTWRMKAGRLADATKLIKETIDLWWRPKKVVVRIYTTDIGPGETIAAEMEAEDEGRFAEIWKQYETVDADKPATKKFWDEFNAMVDRHVMTERWNLAK